MKYFGVAVLCSLLAVTAAAQTNPSLVATNVVPNGRKMSLQDCIQKSLVHNLDVQIQRVNPGIDLYNLYASYGGYDPTLNVSGTHNYVNAAEQVVNNLFTPAAVYNNNSFDSSITGVLPWGLQYDFSGNIYNQYGETFSRNPTNNILTSSPYKTSSGYIQVHMVQPLLKNSWIDNTRMTIQVNKNRLKYSEQGFRYQVITSVTAVENAYYELIFALENLKVQQEALEVSQTQLAQDEQRVTIGTLAELSVQQDKSQVAQNLANLITAQGTLNTDQNTLKNLITDNYSDLHDTDIQPTETLTAPLVLFDLQDSWNRGMHERPDLIQYRLNVEQAGIQLKFYRNQLFPELDVVGTYGWNGGGVQYNDVFGQINQGSAPYYSYGAQLSVPLANQNARNQFKSQKATVKQVVLQLKQYEQNVLVAIDNDVKDAEGAYESVDATRQARIYAEAALDAEQKTYAVGKATTFEVLTYQNMVTGARGQEIRALANYEEALANLYSAEGSTLDRLGINIQTTQ